ncbi:MAG TPA: ECF transporter S component [Tepidimicrobium sp.]|nr:ECF transporter S component [Tepidimicrobium sp.]
MSAKFKKRYNKRSLIISASVILLIIPAIIAIGVKLFNDRKYNLISFIVTFLACIPFFAKFEQRKPRPREILCISVMSTLSVVGRLIFVMLPGFKPVTAITAITGAFLGPESGFLTGALSAIISNIYYGQGPWTPFQMLTWGLLGFIAGILSKFNLMENKIVIILYGIFSGIVFSLMMDIWFVLSIDGLFTWEQYYMAIIAALPFTIIYCISNVVFLLLLYRPIGEKLERVKLKYGLMQN